MTKLTDKNELMHIANPLHVYCRLMDRGLDRGLSVRCCTVYERTLFRVVRLLVSLTRRKPSNHRRKV